jgi:hypothetical protein
MPLIYRVQHPESGYGPYWHQIYEYWHGPVTLHRHPDALDDVDGWKDKNNKFEYIFGFSSLEQLDAWFTAAEQRRLRKHDFVVCVLDVSAFDILVGRSQVAFPGWKPYSYCGCHLSHVRFRRMFTPRERARLLKVMQWREGRHDRGGDDG